MSRVLIPASIFAGLLVVYLAAVLFGAELPSVVLGCLPPALFISGIALVCRVAEAKAESEVEA